MENLPLFVKDFEILQQARSRTDLSLGADGRLHLDNPAESLDTHRLHRCIRDIIVQAKNYLDNAYSDHVTPIMAEWLSGRVSLADARLTVAAIDTVVQTIYTSRTTGLARELCRETAQSYPFENHAIHRSDTLTYARSLVIINALAGAFEDTPQLREKLSALSVPQLDTLTRTLVNRTKADTLSNPTEQVEALLPWLKAAPTIPPFALERLSSSKLYTQPDFANLVQDLSERIDWRALIDCISDCEDDRAIHERLLQLRAVLEDVQASDLILVAGNAALTLATTRPQCFREITEHWSKTGRLVRVLADLPDATKCHSTDVALDDLLLPVLQAYRGIPELQRQALYLLAVRQAVGYSRNIWGPPLHSRLQPGALRVLGMIVSRDVPPSKWIPQADRWAVLCCSQAVIARWLVHITPEQLPALLSVLEESDNPATLDLAQVKETLGRHLSKSEIAELAPHTAKRLEASLREVPSHLRDATDVWISHLLKLDGAHTLQELSEELRSLIHAFVMGTRSHWVAKSAKWTPPVQRILEALTSMPVPHAASLLQLTDKLHWASEQHWQVLIEDPKLVNVLARADTLDLGLTQLVLAFIDGGEDSIAVLRAVMEPVRAPTKLLGQLYTLITTHPDIRPLLVRLSTMRALGTPLLLLLGVPLQQAGEGLKFLQRYCDELLRNPRFAEQCIQLYDCVGKRWNAYSFGAALLQDAPLLMEVLEISAHAGRAAAQLLSDAFRSDVEPLLLPRIQRRRADPDFVRQAIDLFQERRSSLLFTLLDLYESGESVLAKQLMDLASWGYAPLLETLVPEEPWEQAAGAERRFLAALSIRNVEQAEALTKLPVGPTREQLTARFLEGTDITQDLAHALSTEALSDWEPVTGPVPELRSPSNLASDVEFAMWAADAAVGSDGRIDIRCLQQIPGTAYFEALPEGALYRTYLEHTLNILSEHPEFLTAVERCRAPRPKSRQALLVKRMFGYSEDVAPTARDARVAILSALLSSPRQQAIGSCFGTRTEIQAHWSTAGLRQLIEDYLELMETGALRRTTPGETPARIVFPMYVSVTLDDSLLHNENLLVRSHEFCVASMAGGESRHSLTLSNLNRYIPKLIEYAPKPVELRPSQQRLFLAEVRSLLADAFLRRCKEVFLPRLPKAATDNATGVWVLTHRYRDSMLLNIDDYSKLLRECVDDAQHMYMLNHEGQLSIPEWSGVGRFFAGDRGLRRLTQPENLSPILFEADSGEQLDGLAKYLSAPDYTRFALITPWAARRGGSVRGVVGTYTGRIPQLSTVRNAYPERILHTLSTRLLQHSEDILDELRQHPQRRRYMTIPLHALCYLPGQLLAALDDAGGYRQLLEKLAENADTIAATPCGPELLKELRQTAKSIAPAQSCKQALKEALAEIESEPITVAIYCQRILDYFRDLKADNATLAEITQRLDIALLNLSSVRKQRLLVRFADTNWASRGCFLYFTTGPLSKQLLITIGSPHTDSCALKPLYKEALGTTATWSINTHLRPESVYTIVRRTQR